MGAVLVPMQRTGSVHSQEVIRGGGGGGFREEVTPHPLPSPFPHQGLLDQDGEGPSKAWSRAQQRVKKEELSPSPRNKQAPPWAPWAEVLLSSPGNQPAPEASGKRALTLFGGSRGIDSKVISCQVIKIVAAGRLESH